MSFIGKGKNKRIFFWEKIAFRISIGFLFPIAVSAYALYSVGLIYEELTEAKDRYQRMWNSIHVSDGRALLALAKIRMNAQQLLLDPSPTTIAAIQKDVVLFRSDLSDSRKTLLKISLQDEGETEGNFGKFYSQLFDQHKRLAANVDYLIDSVKKKSGADILSAKKEIDKVSQESEVTVGRLKASNELLESKILDRVAAKEFESRRTLIFYLICVSLFGLFTGVIVTLSITSPIKKVLSRIQEIAIGDGDLTKRINTRSGGEMGELAAWMNLFLDKTHTIITTISSASIVVSRTTEQVGNYTEKTSVSASGINKSMMEQSMNLDECTHSLGSIDDLIQSSGESTRQAASLSKIAMDRALQGGASVHETIEAMEKIEESSLKVEELVSSINEIASQTNLLAINAAIEATKAGEHGRGFAVVAEEVRKLAERARKLTAEVTNLINESSTRVKAGVGLAKGAGVSLDGIIKDVEAVASLIQRIAASSTKQTESSAHILDFMEKVSDAVRTNLDEMRGVTHATELTTMEVNKLDSLVGQLNQIVGQFRLESAERKNFPSEPIPEPSQALEESSQAADSGAHSGVAPLPGLPDDRDPGDGEQDAA